MDGGANWGVTEVANPEVVEAVNLVVQGASFGRCPVDLIRLGAENGGHD